MCPSLSFILTYSCFFICHTSPSCFSFFFFNDTATTEIYTLSLHDALPISNCPRPRVAWRKENQWSFGSTGSNDRSEEHTSELQSPDHLVCRLLLEKKKNKKNRCI